MYTKISFGLMSYVIFLFHIKGNASSDVQNFFSFFISPFYLRFSLLTIFRLGPLQMAEKRGQCSWVPRLTIVSRELI